MGRAAGQMQGYSLHYYTLAAPWHDKLPATGFDEDKWFAILRDCRQMERAIAETEEIMDRVDARKRIGLYVDEWGTWYRTEPGHPGYGLYQQNSLRDALVAALTFHIFHEHNDRIHMANIAQTVNVLQAMILTEGEQMLTTPTYHVFGMYKVHHDATRLPVDLTTPDYEFDGQAIPALSVSASRDKNGNVHVSIVNAHARESIVLACQLSGVEATSVSGQILTADEFDAHNTFDKPNQVTPDEFSGAKLVNRQLKVNMPPRSVVVLELAK